MIAAGAASTLEVTVMQDDSVVCVIRNVRKPTPPEPPPTPVADVSVTKSVSPATVSVGDRANATIVVMNHGPDPATDVVVTELPVPGATAISATASQGSCASGACQLGTIAPGAQATITAVAQLNIVGDAVDTVAVRAAEHDPDPENNVASALVRVNSFGPPTTLICTTLRVSPRTMTVGKKVALAAHVLAADGTSIAGVSVHAHGVGVNMVRRSDKHGVARFAVTATHAGILTFRGSGHATCKARVGAVSRAPIPVTG